MLKRPLKFLILLAIFSLAKKHDIGQKCNWCITSLYMKLTGSFPSNIHSNDALETSKTLFYSKTNFVPQLYQIEYTNCILGSVQRGLLLEVQNTGIYGYRQDKCHVFSSTSDPREAHPEPRKMPQNEMVQLLSFQQYENELIAFKENRRGSPDYTIHMCFGEKFPDGKPLEKKLIVVKVVPLICRYFHEVAQEEGASSLQNDNISLQISHHNSLMELINATWPDGPQQAMGQYF